MAPEFIYVVSTNQLLLGAAILGGVAYITVINPSFVPNLISQIQTTVQGFLPQPSTVSGAAVSGTTLNLTSTPTTLTPASALGVPNQLITTPPVSVLQTGTITPFSQNVWCNPSLGMYWDPLQGRCIQQLAGLGGRCAPGSIWNACQCQCVPIGIPQPQCTRNCETSCPDKINTRFDWCALGCVPKSYHGPPCPPLS